MQLTAQAISQMLGGKIEGNPNVIISKPSRIEDGETGSISFLSNPKYEPYVYTTKASVVLVNEGFQPKQAVNSTLIRVENVYIAVAKLLEWYQNGLTEQWEGIASTAVIHETASIGENTIIGDYTTISEGTRIGKNCKVYPQVFIGKNVEIGDNVTLYSGVKIYASCRIGEHCILHSNSVIGADGFGFAPNGNGSYQKIAQIGNVVIERDVEIGANTTIDRATMGSTIVQQGAKIDNLVQIAHNVEIGEHTVIAAQAGVAGSTKIGKYCQIGGQVGFSGHLKIADGTKIQAQSGIASSIKTENTAVFGSPAIPYNSYIKSYAVFKQLPKLYKTIHQLEQKVKELERMKDKG